MLAKSLCINYTSQNTQCNFLPSRHRHCVPLQRACSSELYDPGEMSSRCFFPRYILIFQSMAYFSLPSPCSTLLMNWKADIISFWRPFLLKFTEPFIWIPRASLLFSSWNLISIISPGSCHANCIAMHFPALDPFADGINFLFEAGAACCCAC